MGEDQDDEFLRWQPGQDPVPSAYKSATPFLSTLIPRPLAWCTVNDDDVCLLDGYTSASYTPPTVIFAAAALPPETARALRDTGQCTLSVTTIRDPANILDRVLADPAVPPMVYNLTELGLVPEKLQADYPIAVTTSPLHMFCSVHQYVPLVDDDNDDDDHPQGLFVLMVDIFRMDGSILSPAPDHMKQARPGVTAKIDADLIQPVVSLGEGRWSTLGQLRSMQRPQKTTTPTSNNHGRRETWTSEPFAEKIKPARNNTSHHDHHGHHHGDQFATVEWRYQDHGGTSPLGYNAVTAIIMPRPIGWISTYSSLALNGQRHGRRRVSHLAPYSFFIDVVRGNDCVPLVCFAGYRRNDGQTKKDAQLDSEETGCFAYNLVSQELAVAMNYTAAELDRDGSEFELAGLRETPAHWTDAPLVQDAKITYECQYVRTVDVSNFSIVIGRVQGVSIRADMLDGGVLDPGKLQPILRLGYMDEYGVLAKKPHVKNR